MPFWRHEQIKDKTFESNRTPRDSSSGNEDDIELGVPNQLDGYRGKQPSDRITGHQLFYIFGTSGIGAAVLSGGINFAIAYGMYSTQNVDHPIRLFQLPNTLAGDAVVTIIIQTMMTWFIELNLVGRDLKNNSVQSIGFIGEPSHPFLRWLMLLDRKEDGRREVKDSLKSGRWVARFADHSVRVGLMFVVAFFLLWPASIGILTAVGQRRSGGDWDWYFDRKWAPQAFKAIFGGLLALLTTPLMASFWIVREGWRLKRTRAALTAEGVSQTSL